MLGAFFLHYHLPALRLLIPFIIGILVQWYHPLPLWMVTATVVAILSITLLWVNGPKHWRLYAPALQGFLIHLLLAGLGALLVWVNNPVHKPIYQPALIDKAGFRLHVTLMEPMAEKPRSYKALARMDSTVAPNGRSHPLQGQVMLYFRKSDGRPALGYGNRLSLKKPPLEIENAGNPGGFDYKRHALFHGITHQAFVGKDDYEILPGDGGHPAQRILFAINQWVVGTINTYVPGRDEAAIAAALLVGYRVALDDDLVQAYSNTGVVHIIAISGMHLTMIYALCMAVFGLMGKKGWRRKTGLLVTLGVVWIFALVSGAAPSIVRAAVMLSFVIAGELMKRRSDAFNMLAVSALVLLCWNPFSWWDVGFQLSYAAVAGIMVLQRKFMQWTYFENKSLQFGWSLICVSLAAQTFTLPLVIYHFHQFPLLFLVTNLLAVPVSGFALYALIALMAFAWWPWMATLAGKVAAAFIAWLNSFILLVNAVPYGLVDGIQLSLVQATLLMCCFVLSAVCWLHKQRSAGWWAGVFLVIFLGIHVWDYALRSQQRTLIVYNLPKATGIDLVHGFHYRFVGDDSLRSDGFMRNFHLKPARVQNRSVALADTSARLFMDGGFYAFGKKIKVIHDRLPRNPPPQPDTAALVLLCGNPKIRLENIRQHVVAAHYVADGSNSRWRLQQWGRVADSLHLPLHITTQKGAYVQQM